MKKLVATIFITLSLLITFLGSNNPSMNNISIHETPQDTIIQSEVLDTTNVHDELIKHKQESIMMSKHLEELKTQSAKMDSILNIKKQK